MESLKIKFVGDISLNGAYNETLFHDGAYYLLKKIRNELQGADLVIGNLESPLLPREIPPAFKMKTPLRGDPAYAEALKWAGFDILNLSNNHILDYGEIGVASTVKALEQERIMYFGYGQNIADAERMLVVTVRGTKVGFIGYTDLVIDSPFYATGTTRGIAKLEIDRVCSHVENCKKQVDILVVSLHWGIEYFQLPRPVQREQARRLIDSGATLIIGHHPHTLQGIERYKHGLIAYSLGNFIFSDIRWDWFNENGERRTTYYKFSGRLRQGVILSVNFTEEGICGYGAQPTCISSSGEVLPGSQKIVRRLEYLSKQLNQHPYEGHFERQLRRFERRKLIEGILKRARRLHKLRPKHLKELMQLICRRTR